MFGVFPHTVETQDNTLMRGFDDVFYAPHSRHTTINREDIEEVDALTIIASSEEAGVYAVESAKHRQIYITGHSEYDADTLEREYLRDKNAGLPIEVPKNYYPNNDDTKPPRVTWRGHAKNPSNPLLAFSTSATKWLFVKPSHSLQSLRKSGSFCSTIFSDTVQGL